MITRSYHYLISGLPVISYGDRMWKTANQFRAFLEEHLHPEDFRQVRLVFLLKDHHNLLSYLEKGDIHEESGGNFNLTDFSNPDDNAAATEENALPAYMTDILLAHAGSKEEPDIPEISHALDEGYFNHIMAYGDTFLKKYFTFEYNLKNLLAFVKAGNHNLEQKGFITADTSLTRHLEMYVARTLAADPEFEHFEEILSAAASKNLAEAEKHIDKLKWRVIDEMNLFEYFTIDRVLGYLLQMLILERWDHLDKATGEARLRELIDAAHSRMNSETGLMTAAPSPG